MHIFLFPQESSSFLAVEWPNWSKFELHMQHIVSKESRAKSYLYSKHSICLWSDVVIVIISVCCASGTGLHPMGLNSDSQIFEFTEGFSWCSMSSTKPSRGPNAVSLLHIFYHGPYLFMCVVLINKCLRKLVTSSDRLPTVFFLAEYVSGGQARKCVYLHVFGHEHITLFQLWVCGHNRP